VQPKSAQQWRWSVKNALASTISLAHEHGLAEMLARGPERPLVLGYHRVVEDFAASATIEMPSMLTSRAMFERHLDCIGKHFRFVGVEDIGARLESGEPFTERVAAITFDDGYRDVYDNAYPVLQRRGIPATMFVVTDLLSRPSWQVHDRLYYLVAKAFRTWDDPRRELHGLLSELGLPADDITRGRASTKSPLVAVSALLPGLPQADVHRLMDGLEASVGNGFHDVPQTMTWDMVLEMHRAGFTIGSHTRSHVSLPAESPERVAEELAGSKRAIEERIGEPVRHFCYPGGQFNCTVVKAVERAGYDFAYTACTHGVPQHSKLTIERLLLWEGSSVDGAGQFSPAVLSCQAHDLWPPARKCGRVHHA